MKNVLLITADEMRSDCAGFAGNPDVKTPHLDALAARGTVFENHFTPFPKCVPARCAMHTGRYTHTDGLRTVMGPNHLPKGDPNLGEFLREQGYETAVLGLNHVWEEDWFFGSGGERNQVGAGVVHYTSFTEGPMADQAMAEREYPAGKPREGKGPQALLDAGFHYGGLITGKHRGFGDDNRADQARLYLRELRDPEKPFFLQLNISKPHPPYEAHEPWYSMYDPDKIDPFPFDLPENAPLALRAQREHRTGNDIPPESARELQALYYSMISFVDDLVGQVLAELEAQGLRDDTLIIFTSDHGDYAGQFGLIEKWDASLHDSLMHVPFVMAGPGAPAGQRVAGLTEHTDLPATILDYLGLEKPAHWVWHGESILPALAGKTVKDAVFGDGGHEKAMRERFDHPTWQEKDGRRCKATLGKQLTYEQCPDSMARCMMVRTQDWKLVVRETGDHELYHLPSDPHEMKNIYHEAPWEVLRDLQMRLLQWRLHTDQDRPFLEKFGA